MSASVSVVVIFCANLEFGSAIISTYSGIHSAFGFNDYLIFILFEIYINAISEQVFENESPSNLAITAKHRLTPVLTLPSI